MNILVACKIVDDDQDVKIGGDGSLDFSRAHKVISIYDKNAIEAANMLKGDDTLKAISVGSAKDNDSKVEKDILARGIDELYMTSDDSTAGLDALATGVELAKIVSKIGDYDVIVVGDGSADLYARQTGVQLAAELGTPYVSGIVEVAEADGKVMAKRLLENELELVEVSTPCVLSVTPNIAEARICGMKDILAAGKKPKTIEGAEDAAQNATAGVAVKAPAEVNRKQQIFTDINEFAAAVKAAL